MQRQQQQQQQQNNFFSNKNTQNAAPKKPLDSDTNIIPTAALAEIMAIKIVINSMQFDIMLIIMFQLIGTFVP